MKTLEEFAIKEIQDLRKEVHDLQIQNDCLNIDYSSAKNRRDYWENKYNKLVEKLEEDFKPKLETLANGKDYFSFSNCFSTNGTDDYYIKVFNLKEVKETTNE